MILWSEKNSTNNLAGIGSMPTTKILSIVGAIMNGTLSKICSVFKVDQYIFGYKYLKKTIISTKVVSTDKAT